MLKLSDYFGVHFFSDIKGICKLILLLQVILFIRIVHKSIQCIYKYVLVLLYKCNTGILQFKYIKSNRWISVKLLIIIYFIFNPVILIINIFKIKNFVKYKH